MIGKSLSSDVADLAADRGLPAVWLTPLLDRPGIVAALARTTRPTLLVGGTADPTWQPDVLPDNVMLDRLELDGLDHGLQAARRPAGLARRAAQGRQEARPLPRRAALSSRRGLTCRLATTSAALRRSLRRQFRVRPAPCEPCTHPKAFLTLAAAAVLGAARRRRGRRRRRQRRPRATSRRSRAHARVEVARLAQHAAPSGALDAAQVYARAKDSGCLRLLANAAGTRRPAPASSSRAGLDRHERPRGGGRDGGHRQGRRRRDPSRDRRRPRRVDRPRAAARRRRRRRDVRAAAARRLRRARGRRRDVRDRQPVRARPHAHERRRLGARPPDRRAQRLRDRPRDPDRRADQPRQLRRPAARRPRPRDRRQLADPQRRRLAAERQRRHRLRGPRRTPSERSIAALEADGQVEHAYLGVQMAPSRETATACRSPPSPPAARPTQAGLQPGDEIARARRQSRSTAAPRRSRRRSTPASPATRSR